jgi:hypothetical protein
MGLDMYLEGVKFFWTDWKNPSANPHDDGFRIKEYVLELGYWRKHPNLHGYIVKEFAKGEDNCEPVDLSADQLRQILKASEEDALPHTDGFFFGKSQPEDKVETKQRLEKAIAWLEQNDPKTHRSVRYRASW